MSEDIKLKFSRCFYIEFFSSFVIAFLLPTAVFYLINLYAISHPESWLTHIIFFDLTVYWVFPLLLIAIISSAFWKFLKNAVPIYSKLLNTPPNLIFSLHGWWFGFTASTIFILTMYFCDLQSVLFFSGDYVAFAIVIGLILYLLDKSILSKPAKNKSIATQGSNPLYILDEQPIEDIESDQLQHDKVVEEIKRIVDGETGQCGKVIALYGRNGSGKTSILKLLSKTLNESGEVKVVQFDPYKYKSDREMTKGFFDALTSSLNESALLPGITNIREDYLSLIYGLKGTASFFELTFKHLGEMLFKPKTHDDLKKNIEWYLSRFNLRMVLIIDNLDRCSIKNRQSVFQLINTVGKVNNLYFIIAASHNELLASQETTLVSLVE
ncbi:MAG: P-loop NTPase fold protein [Deltaproteobacteria bacterium]|nr:P-loop NTPase fold protein [Deltaproteobacteria bacterium]